MTPSAHLDPFARDNLPPRAQWPDFLFDLPDQVHWVLHLSRAAITHLARPDGQVAPLADGGPMTAARARDKDRARIKDRHPQHAPCRQPARTNAVGDPTEKWLR